MKITIYGWSTRPEFQLGIIECGCWVLGVRVDWAAGMDRNGSQRLTLMWLRMRSHAEWPAVSQG